MISHIGIAVPDLDAAVERYKLLTGVADPQITEVPEQKVRVAIFPAATPGGARIELLEPTSPDSPIAGFLAKRGGGLHHLCLYTDDITARLAELSTAGVKLIDKTPRTGAEGGRIAFVHPADLNGVLVELEEKKN
jgi:methylmalonyl-CoA/ethylmalonyl-CoA epimerase